MMRCGVDTYDPCNSQQAAQVAFQQAQAQYLHGHGNGTSSAVGDTNAYAQMLAQQQMLQQQYAAYRQSGYNTIPPAMATMPQAPTANSSGANNQLTNGGASKSHAHSMQESATNSFYGGYGGSAMPNFGTAMAHPNMMRGASDSLSSISGHSGSSSNYGASSSNNNYSGGAQSNSASGN